MLRTNANIKRQANHPDAKAVTKPIPIAVTERPVAAGVNSPPTMPKNACPKMGIKTIRKEKGATLSFSTPNINPVAMVAPDLESPGMTAHACATPIINASKNLMGCVLPVLCLLTESQ